MFKFRVLVLAAVCLLACCPASLFADPTYEYRFDQLNYSVAPSGTVPVNVYLREIVTSGDTTLLDSEGLFGTGVRVEFNVPPLPSQPAQIASPVDITYNAVFDGFSLIDHVPADSGGFTATIGFGSPSVTGTAGPGLFEIFLGTFIITAGAAPGQITNIRATDFGLSDDNITSSSFTILDGLIAEANATITVQGMPAVPDPATWATWLIAGTIGLATSRRFRLRKCGKTERRSSSTS